MSNQISNNEEFEQNLKRLGDLYEEGKNCAKFLCPINGKDMVHWHRIFDILKEMRDLAAVQMQHKHFLNEN